MPRRPLLALLLCVAVHAHAGSSNSPAVAIIIDDLGNDLAAGLRVARLPGTVACAILPHTPYGQHIAELAFRQGKDVLLHLPMSGGEDREPGPGQFEEGISDGELRATLNLDLATVPHVSGINNHMGSRLTQSRPAMDQLMRQLSARHLWFVDSLTHGASVAAERARAYGIPVLKRDVFLDHDPGENIVDQQLAELEGLARRRGFALAIGHPYPTTLSAIEKWMTGLRARGLRLISPSTRMVAVWPGRQGEAPWSASSSR